MYTGKQHQSDIYMSIFYTPSSAVTSNVPKHPLIQKLTTKFCVNNKLTFKVKSNPQVRVPKWTQASKVLRQVAIRKAVSACQAFP